MGRISESRLIMGDEVLVDADRLSLSPPTTDGEPVHGNLVLVERGCEPSDYPAAVDGNIILVQRGASGFGQISEMSNRAGAVAAIIYNLDAGPMHGTLGKPSSSDRVATFGLSGEAGERYARMFNEGYRVECIAYVDSEVTFQPTTNIIAQTAHGDPENCVMLGAHTDGGRAGPGINDDRSGSMSLLEIATQLSKFTVNNCVRLAWWSAEEEGLLGSNYYVANLPEEEKSAIRLFMDYDRVASPNFAYQIYDANNEDHPRGSGELRKLYVDWYQGHDLNYAFNPVDGRSDYDAFIKAGIPAGGIGTGAEGGEDGGRGGNVRWQRW